MKCGWITSTLGEQITLQRGFDITKDEMTPGSVPVISSGGINGYHNVALAKGPGVLLGRKGSVGKVHYVETDYWPHDTTLWVKDFGGNWPRFVYHFFAQFPIWRYEASTANPSLNRNNLHPVRVLWPPFAEQQRIAEVLDRAEALRAKRRAALAQLDSLTQSLFLDTFGDPLTNPKAWPRIPLGELLTGIESGWSPTCLDRPSLNNEWGVLKLGAITRCEYRPAENKALPPGIDPDPKLEVKRGDLLFARKNTYELVAACALVSETPPRLMMSDLIFRLCTRSDVAVDKSFLHQLLIYPSKRREIQKLAGGSAGSMPNISKARLHAAPVELPPLPLQQEFARRVTAIERLKTAHRASLAELDALFASLQYRAFRGEL